MRMRLLWTAGLLVGLSIGVQAQDSGHQGIPYEVYYLMPAFSQGTVYLDGQAPAQGLLNICALDNTLRFKDKSGQELSATNADNIVRVQIDTVVFLRDGGAFYRMCPVSPGIGLAIRRDVKPVLDAKPGAYGTVSQTSAIQRTSSLYVDGATFDLSGARDYPYNLEETLFLYRGNDVLTFNRKNLRKCFPQRKEEIDAFFKAGNSLPETLPEARELLSRWAAE